MRYTFFLYLLSIFSFSLSAQKADTWTAFWNKDTTLFGYKDGTGKVRIEPKFSHFSFPNKFDDIISVTQEKNGVVKSFYLTKAGKVVGRDSMFFGEETDCESEGFIRFKVKPTEKVGLFNRKGEIVIPAGYDALSKVKNGMVWALKDGTKKYWDEGKESGCHHYSWVGGEGYLLDTNNKVLIENFRYNENINFHSLLKTAFPGTDSTRLSVVAKDGMYYSFIRYKKEFEKWLKTNLLDAFTYDNLLAATYEKVTYYDESEGWVSKPKKAFLDKNFETIKSKLIALKSRTCHFNIFEDSLNGFIYEDAAYSDYFDNCGNAKEWMYPVMGVVITYDFKKDLHQDHFDFLRTANGYKLLSVSFSRTPIK